MRTFDIFNNYRVICHGYFMLMWNWKLQVSRADINSAYSAYADNFNGWGVLIHVTYHGQTMLKTFTLQTLVYMCILSYTVWNDSTESCKVYDHERKHT